MLVPLFGTYDVLYGIWPWIDDQQTKIAFLLIVRLICSFQVKIRFSLTFHMKTPVNESKICRDA